MPSLLASASLPRPSSAGTDQRDHIREAGGPTFTLLARATGRISSRKRATGGGKMASTASLGRRMFSSSRRILDNTPDRKRVVVAMSGGVDSSVAAHLLRESHPGADIVGLHVSCFAAASQLNSPCTACGQLGAI